MAKNQTDDSNLFTLNDFRQALKAGEKNHFDPLEYLQMTINIPIDIEAFTLYNSEGLSFGQILDLIYNPEDGSFRDLQVVLDLLSDYGDKHAAAYNLCRLIALNITDDIGAYAVLVALAKTEHPAATVHVWDQIRCNFYDVDLEMLVSLTSGRDEKELARLAVWLRQALEKMPKQPIKHLFDLLSIRALGFEAHLVDSEMMDLLQCYSIQDLGLILGRCSHEYYPVYKKAASVRGFNLERINRLLDTDKLSPSEILYLLEESKAQTWNDFKKAATEYIGLG